jgi:hypothetical protein
MLPKAACQCVPGEHRVDMIDTQFALKPRLSCSNSPVAVAESPVRWRQFATASASDKVSR